MGNNGPSDTDYAALIAQRQQTASSGPFKTGNSPTAFADLDQSYSPINAGSGGATAGRVTVGEGDTLRSIAQAVWGDASLWYMIAQANGLSGAESLAAGMTLAIPAKVANLHHTSDTFRVYDPNKAIGDISPTTPAPIKPQGKKGCGVVGQILVVVIAAAVVWASQGALTSFSSTLIGTAFGTAAATSAVGVAVAGAAGAAMAGALGSIAGQGFAVITGQQDKISWKGVAMAAIAAAVGGGPGPGNFAEMTTGAFAQGLVRGAASNAITQKVAVAVGLQDHFSWSAVAIGGIVSGVTSWAGGQIASLTANSAIGNATTGVAGAFNSSLTNGMLNNGLSGAAGAIVGAGTRSLIKGTNFGDNIMAVLPDVIGATIGNAIGQSLATKPARDVMYGSAGNDTLLGGSGPNEDTLLSRASNLKGRFEGFLKDPFGSAVRAAQSAGSWLKAKIDYTSGQHGSAASMVGAGDGESTWLAELTITARKMREGYNSSVGLLNFVYDSGVGRARSSAESKARAAMALQSQVLWNAGALADRAGMPGVGGALKRQAVIGPSFAAGAAGSGLDLASNSMKSSAFLAYNANPLAVVNGLIERTTGINLPGPNLNRITDPIAERLASYVSGQRDLGADASAAIGGEFQRVRAIGANLASDDLSRVAQGAYDTGDKTVDYGTALAPLGGAAVKGVQIARVLAASERVAIGAEVVAAESAGVRGFGTSPYATNGDLVQSIATRADDWGVRQGLGNGPVAGTLKHGYSETLLNRYQRMFGDRGLTAEARYVNGNPWQSGDPLAGSLRLDVVEGPLTNPTQVWDYKFGQATLSQSRITQIQTGIPNGANVPILMVKP